MASKNHLRRHLTTGQRAMVIADTLAEEGKRLPPNGKGGKGRWARDSVPAISEFGNSGWERGSVPTANHQLVNSDDWRTRMYKAGLILDHAPDLVDKVVAGDMAFGAAVEKAEKNRVLAYNDERRHLSNSQRAMARALTLEAGGRRRNGRWTRGSVPVNSDNGKFSDSEFARALSKAGVILDYAPELAPKVVAGETALDAAYQEAQEKRDAAKRIAEMGPDLAALVEAKVITLAEAERRADEAERLKKLPEHFVEREDWTDAHKHNHALRVVGKALSLLDEKLQGRPGRPEKALRPVADDHDPEETVHNVNGLERPWGNSQAAALRRLRKDRPDLLARVEANELSANAAMVEAGFRHRTTTTTASALLTSSACRTSA